jgi:hypothetical protein
MESVTLVKIVGLMKYPLVPSLSPPRLIVAPSDFPNLMNPSIESN